MVKNREQFLKTIKELELYLVEFEKNGTMKTKNYPSICKIKVDKCQPIIVITYNKYTFLSNNDICKGQTQIGDIFLQLKDCGQGITMTKFLLLFRRFNLSSFPKDKKKRVKEKAEITITKAVILFKYEKANKKY